MKSRSHTALAILFAAATLTAACSKGSDGPSAPPGNSTALLDVTNNTNISIWSVRIRSCGATSWSSDLLGADIIPPGLGQSFTIAAGCHDVRLVSEPSANGEAVWTNVAFPAGQVTERIVTTWTPVN